MDRMAGATAAFLADRQTSRFWPWEMEEPAKPRVQNIERDGTASVSILTVYHQVLMPLVTNWMVLGGSTRRKRELRLGGIAATQFVGKRCERETLVRTAWDLTGKWIN